MNGGRAGLAGYFGWGGLGLAVLVGAGSSGLSGAASMFGMYALVVGLLVMVRGRVGWAHLRRRAASAVALAAAFAAFTVSAVAAPGHSHAGDSRYEAGRTIPRPTTAARETTRPTAAPASPTKSSVKTPAPQPTVRRTMKGSRPRAHRRHAVGGIIVNSAGAVLPDRARTPGALNPAVTQATIGRTICVSGWTSTVRPSSSVTTDLKVAQLASGYSYKGDTSTSDYEEDHLIPLELGGAPSDPANLWPEPYNSREGARVKDLVENRLHALVCSHTINLATAQRAIASNWWAAYKTFGGSAYSSSSHAPVHHTSPAPVPAAPGDGATARCNDGTYSYAAHHQGACSSHGGVQVFYK